VADALSRQNINAIQGEPQSDVATIHSELSLTYTVESTGKPSELLQESNNPGGSRAAFTATFHSFRDQKPTHNPVQ